MKARYLPWRCPECAASNVKGTDLPENDLECRGKCFACPRSVRNVYANIERTWHAGGFPTRRECKQFCDALNDERTEVIQ